MTSVLSLVFIFFLPFSAIAHPGKTDYRGGHKCWKNCSQWELLRGEYHLHDKDWNPIRLDHKGDVTQPAQPKSVPTPGKRFLQEEAVEPPVDPEPEAEKKAIVEKHVAVTVYEESILPFNIILLLVLVFLMFILLLFVRKKRHKE